jgi:hypothetical protein
LSNVNEAKKIINLQKGRMGDKGDYMGDGGRGKGDIL